MRASLLILYLTSSIDAFSISISKHPTCHIDVETYPMGVGCCTTTTPRPQTRVYSRLLCAISSSSEASSATKGVIPTGESYSTLTLLEHMHLLTPNAHNDIVNSNDSKGSNMIDLFVNTLGFGLDPKSVDNINKKSGMFFKSDSPFLANDMKYHICILLSYMYILSIKSSGVVFVNCGASQLHLNDDIDYCQKMEMLQKDIIKEGDSTHPTYEIGLRYNSLSLLKEELSKADKNLCKYTIIDEGGERETIRITDPHGRIFIAREAINDNVGNENATDEPSISSICQQKIICKTDQDDVYKYGSEIVEKYGKQQPSSTTTLCQGIDYIEFFVPVHKDDGGKTIDKIASFYEFFFDAPTTVTHDGTSNIAIIGFGKIDENGRAEQSLLFRERFCESGTIVNNDEIGTGHHIAIYIGANVDQYVAAVENCIDGGLLWINQQFEDRVLNVEKAIEVGQFRFKDIIDIENGDVLYSIEHEIRSVNHPLFPGVKCKQ